MQKGISKWGQGGRKTEKIQSTGPSTRGGSFRRRVRKWGERGKGLEGKRQQNQAARVILCHTE